MRAAARAAVHQPHVLDLAEPWIATHRGMGGAVGKDDALSSMAYTVENFRAGIPLLDIGDLRIGSDSSLLVNHDASTSRTIAGTAGNVSAETAATWAARRLGLFPYTSTPPAASTEPPPFWAQVLDLGVASRIPFSAEPKVPGSATQMIADVVAAGVGDSFLLCSFNLADITAAKAAGVKTLQVNSEATFSSAASIIAAAPDYVGFDFTGSTNISDAWLSSLIAAGMKLVTFTLLRGSERTAVEARVAALGGSIAGIYADDPMWVAGVRPARTTDTFASGTYDLGMIETAPNKRATFSAGKLVFDSAAASQWILLGFMAQPAVPSRIVYTVTYDTPSATATAYPGMIVCSPDDAAAAAQASGGALTGSGYVCGLDLNGLLRINTLTNGSLSAASSLSTTAITAGQSVQMQIDITPTTVKLTRLDTGQNVTRTSSAFRGRYFSMGKANSGASTYSFSGVTVTP